MYFVNILEQCSIMAVSFDLRCKVFHNVLWHCNVVKGLSNGMKFHHHGSNLFYVLIVPQNEYGVYVLVQSVEC